MKAQEQAAPIEYTPADGEDVWKVEKFPWLRNEFYVRREQLAEFHAVASRFSLPWKIIRMIYGINQVVMPVGCDADFMRSWSRLEVGVKLGLGADQIQDNLDTVLAAWRKVEKDRPHPDPLPQERESPKPTYVEAPAPEPAATIQPKSDPIREQTPTVEPAVEHPKPKPEKPARVKIVKTKTVKENGVEVVRKVSPIELPPLANPEHTALLLRYGFTDGTFGDGERDVQDALVERQWFLLRLMDLQKLFDEPAVSSQARQALLHELFMRRLDAKMMLEEVDSAKFAHLQETKNGIEGQFTKAWNQITEIMPWAAQVGNKINFAGTISDVLVAIREYMADGNNRRIDGLRTALELQIEMRASVQHEIRYRPGQTAAILEAVGGMWDPNWKRTIPDKVCKMLDEGLREGAKRVREESGVELPDIEDEGPRGEYPPLFEAPAELEEPTINVEVEVVK